MNSRTKGHAYERKLAREFRLAGWTECQTSRFESKMLDDKGVDFTNTKPFNIQAKAMERTPAYHDILKGMPKDTNYNVIFHKRNNKGEVVVMSKDDFYELVLMLKSII